jgi:hypothetical protein
VDAETPVTLGQLRDVIAETCRVEVFDVPPFSAAGGSFNHVPNDQSMADVLGGAGPHMEIATSTERRLAARLQEDSPPPTRRRLNRKTFRSAFAGRHGVASAL